MKNKKIKELMEANKQLKEYGVTASINFHDDGDGSPPMEYIGIGDKKMRYNFFGSPLEAVAQYKHMVKHPSQCQK